jgi:8-oxo-dGTP diphosphatase
MRILAKQYFYPNVKRYTYWMRKAARAIVIKDDQLLVMHRNKFGKEYYTLPGGGIEPNETPEQTVIRELVEETGVVVAIERLVFIENPGAIFGTQYVFLCSYQSGQPVLHPDSEEAASNRSGQNLYTPMWLPVEKLSQVTFMSPKLRQALQKGLASGFPMAAETL